MSARVAAALENVPLPGEGESPWQMFPSQPDAAYELNVRVLARGMLAVVDEADETPANGFGDWLRAQLNERFPGAFEIDPATGSAWMAPTGLQWAAAQNALHSLRGTPAAVMAGAGETHPSVLLMHAGEYDPDNVDEPKPKPRRTRASTSKRKPSGSKASSRKGG